MPGTVWGTGILKQAHSTALQELIPCFTNMIEALVCSRQVTLVSTQSNDYLFLLKYVLRFKNLVNLQRTIRKIMAQSLNSLSIMMEVGMSEWGHVHRVP